MHRSAAISCILTGIFGILPFRFLEPQSFGPTLGLLDTSRPITYIIDDGNRIPGYRASDRDLAKMALDAWSRESGGKLKFVEITERDDALLRVRWTSPDDGLFGEMERIIVKGRAGAIVNVNVQVTQLGEPLSTRAVEDVLLRDTIVYLTCVHELGHAVGLPHTRNFEDIMYYFGYGGNIAEYFMRYRNKLQSRADIARYSGVSARETAFLRNLYK